METSLVHLKKKLNLIIKIMTVDINPKAGKTLFVKLLVVAEAIVLIGFIVLVVVESLK